ncbi:MAG TPA: hypothetical protein VLG37_03905 [Candidatus Saccharimonadales bacterium]|nr:hypothetical protein [Candidatus Saccharimonadales bacterium]
MIERLQPSEHDSLRDVGELPSDGETTIDDARVHGILARLGVILHDQIADANTFFMHGGGYDHRLAFPMNDIELAGWESVFDIDKVVEAAIDERSLFVVNIDDEQRALPTSSDDRKLVRPYTTEPMQRPRADEASGDMIRVNYGGEAHWIPRHLLTLVESTDDLTYLIKPQLHFGGSGGAAGQLYNAFVALDTYVQAGNGTQLVSKIPGTGIVGSPTSKPVYSPHTAIKTSLWMNTSIKEGAPNGLSVTIDNPEQLMLSCAVHDIDTLPQLDVPRSDKLRMWFWQLDRLISDQRLALPTTPSPPIEEK